MDTTQPVLDLFDPAPFSFVPVCSVCGKHGDPVPVDGGAGAPWREAEQWCYLAVMAHKRAEHPEVVAA